MYKNINILAAALDWGLGHASRMIPILRPLYSENHLMIGVNKSTAPILKAEFPNADFYELPSYHIRYSSTNSHLAMIKLIPGMIKAKRKEHKWLQEFVKTHQTDLIISDSRFGFYHPQIKSIIISHQLSLAYPSSLSFFGQWAQKINEKWLSSFQEIWIPDTSEHLMSGKLSKNTKLNSKFIGIQSRFSQLQLPKPVEKEYILAIISGPEPQRSTFEKLLIQQKTKTHLVIIGGNPQNTNTHISQDNMSYFHHLSKDELQAYIQHASFIISRSGYSSLMDYWKLSCKKVYLIPTPGQTEQEYLAKRMKKQNICDYSLQQDFQIQNISFESSAFNGFRINY